MVQSVSSTIRKFLAMPVPLKVIIQGLAILGLAAAILFTGPITQIFVIIGIALFFFTTELLPVDMTAMLVMLLVIISGLVTPTEGFSGFSSTATITVLCMFILSSGVEKTGLINKMGRALFKFAGKSQIRQLLIIALVIGPISGFLNNTAAVAIFLPMIVALAIQAKTPATKLLIPLSFISMLGGTLTLIGTSTNILASSMLPQYELNPLGMFEFSHIGLIVLFVGVFYFLTIGRFILPSRKNEVQEEGFLPSHFLATLRIRKTSKMVGRTIKELKFGTKYNLEVLKLVRGGKSHVKNLTKMKLQHNDLLVLAGDEQRIIDFDRKTHEDLAAVDNPERRVGRGKIIKVVIKSTFFHQKLLSEINFWSRYSVSLIGIHRKELEPGHISNLELKHGEVLLVKTSETSLKRLRKSNDFLVLEEIEGEYRESKTPIAVGIVAWVILLAALNILPISVAALFGVLAMFVTRCLRPEEVYDAVNWDIIFLLAGVIPLGLALQNSGGADLIAQLIVDSAGFLSPMLVLMSFYLITTVMTEIISNNAAVVLLIPIGISVADKLELNPMAFVLAVMFAASTSFLTPVGYQTNTMVYGTGNYKFSDFIKVGAPLNLILLFVTTYLIVHFFGL